MRMPTASELVEAAKRGLSVAGDKQLDLALYSRYGVSPGQPLVNKWANDRGQPNYEYTIVLLAAAGWLNEDRLAAASVDAAQRVAEEAERLARDVPGQQPQEEQETG